MDLDRLRNIGIVAHIDAGKTTTSERILYYTGKNYKIGEVHDGAATMDWMTQEQERGITITSAATHCIWKCDNIQYNLNLIDTPGHVDFTIEVERSLRILDGAVVIICGVSGVQPQTSTVWRQADAYHVPRICFINKLDRKGVEYDDVIEQIDNISDLESIVVTYPIGFEDQLSGVIDIIEKKAYFFEDESLGAVFNEGEIPTELIPKVEQYYETILDVLSNHDDTLLEAILNEEKIDSIMIKKLIRKLCIENKVVPIFSGSSFKNKGVQQLLDGIIHYLPSPVDLKPTQGEDDKGKEQEVLMEPKSNLVAFVFKIQADSFSGIIVYLKIYSGVLEAKKIYLNANQNKKERINKIYRVHSNRREEIEQAQAGDIVAVSGLNSVITGDTICDIKKNIKLENLQLPKPVISVAVEPKTASDTEKFNKFLEIVVREDPSLKIDYNEDTGQQLLSGMGELHLEIIVDRLKKEQNLDINVGQPQVAYKEKVSQIIEVEETFDKPLLGKESYAKINLQLSPRKNGMGSSIEFNIDDNGLYTKELLILIENEIKEALLSGVIAGYEVIDTLVKVNNINFGELKENLNAAKIVTALAVRKGLLEGKSVLYEPIMKIVVVSPLDSSSDVIADMNLIGGKIVSIEEENQQQLITVINRLSAMFGYMTRLRSLSKGRATFSMSFDHYDKFNN